MCLPLPTASKQLSLEGESSLFYPLLNTAQLIHFRYMMRLGSASLTGGNNSPGLEERLVKKVFTHERYRFPQVYGTFFFCFCCQQFNCDLVRNRFTTTLAWPWLRGESSSPTTSVPSASPPGPSTTWTTSLTILSSSPAGASHQTESPPI